MLAICKVVTNNYRCNVVPFAATGQLGAVAMDCDHVVFAGDAPQLPYGAPIVAYTQRHSGQQTLPAQVGEADPPILSCIIPKTYPHFVVDIWPAEVAH